MGWIGKGTFDEIEVSSCISCADVSVRMQRDNAAMRC